MAVGMIVGSVFENSIIVTILSALGSVIKGWNDFKKFALKVDMSHFAFTTYEKAMIELRSYARGLPLDELDRFLIKMQTLDETVLLSNKSLAHKSFVRPKYTHYVEQ